MRSRQASDLAERGGQQPLKTGLICREKMNPMDDWHENDWMEPWLR